MADPPRCPPRGGGRRPPRVRRAGSASSDLGVEDGDDLGIPAWGQVQAGTRGPLDAGERRTGEWSLRPPARVGAGRDASGVRRRDSWEWSQGWGCRASVRRPPEPASLPYVLT
jgi:hypothetical protein